MTDFHKQALQAAFQEAKILYTFGGKISSTNATVSAHPNQNDVCAILFDPLYQVPAQVEKKKLFHSFSIFKKPKDQSKEKKIARSYNAPFSQVRNDDNGQLEDYQIINSNINNNTQPIQTTALQILPVMNEDYYNNSSVRDKFPESIYAIGQYESALNDTLSDKDAIKVTGDFLKAQKCLWNHNVKDENSFTNIFLTCLRHHSVETYKSIIEENYLKHHQAHFQRGEATLYRGDSRPSDVIFHEGFKLWAHANPSNLSKDHYAHFPSWQFGVSLARNKYVAARFSGGNGYYVVHLPPDHKLLLLAGYDVLAFGREVNSMDDIPPQYIQSLVHQDDEILNPNYQENVVLSPKIRRGCY